jgi:hypothetical protein
LVYLYILRLYSGNVIVNDYVVPAVKCRDISMVVRRLYFGNVIINDYVVLAVTCRDIPMVVRRLYSGNARIKTPDDHWYISTFYSQDYVIIDYNIARIKTLVVRRLYSGNVIINDYILQPGLRIH